MSYAGECDLSQSRNAASTRDCQPWPVVRKAPTTSGDRRIVMRSFVIVDFGRPRSFACSEAGKAEKGLKVPGSTSERSPTSPLASIKGKRETMFYSFFQVSFAKTDDTNAKLSLTEYQHVQPIIKVADGDEARIWVGFTHVLPDFRCLEIERLCLIER